MVDKETTIDHGKLKEQLEYYLSDKNLKQDEFFNKVLKESESKSIPIELFLNCNKVKQSKATKDDIIKAFEGSQAVILLPDRTGVKRKSDTVPDLEPKFTKKNKSNGGDDSRDGSDFKEQMFKYSLSKSDESIKWDAIQKEVEAQHGVKVVYSRLNDGLGHFAVNKYELKPEQKEALLTGIKIGDTDVKIEECSDQDLRDFYRDHGKHLDIILERVGLKKKRKGKSQSEFIFLNQRHHNLTTLRNTFRDILQRSTDGEMLKEAEHNMVLELLKYHDKYEAKAKDLKGFTTGTHPEYKNTRCFFAVKEDGSKEDFSSTKCLENIKKKFNLSD